MSNQGFHEGKPGKYEFLIRILTDATHRYVVNMELYAQRSEISNSAVDVVTRLVTPIKNSGRNVTTDRFYTSVDQAEKLWHSYKLTLVGTMQAYRKHIPEILKSTAFKEFLAKRPSTVHLGLGQ